MSDKRAVFVYSSQFEKMNYPKECPFNISRAPRTRNLLKSMDLLEKAPTVKQVVTEPADRETLKKFHTPRYLDALQRAAQGEHDIEALHMGIGSPDCPIFKDMYNYSALTCGASLLGVRMILSQETDLAFNPSGGLHHSGPEMAAGFCYMNDIALACLVLSQSGKRVLYLDIDVHHGDGVQNAFYDRDDVFMISMHESGKDLFPGTGFVDEIGTGKGKGYNVNLPLIIGTYDEIYLHAFNEAVLPLIKVYNPDVIVFELGTDTLAGDPLAHLRLTNNAYVYIIEQLLGFEKPILMTGGGGYNIENTVRAWALAWSVLSGLDSQNHDLNIGLGGVFMQSTDWAGGLRDRELPISEDQKQIVEPAVQKVIDEVKKTIFPYHGL